MKIDSFPFNTIDWSRVPKEEHAGETGMATWRVQKLNNIRIRMVEYSPGYSANHWCSKGHVLFCYEGDMQTELEDGRIMNMTQGMCYFVGDGNEAHRSTTKTGCKLFIVD